MNKINAVVVLVLIAASLAVAAPAEKVTLQGEILDLACYLEHEAQGAGHAGCAKACLEEGQPMGLLAADGKVWLLLADHSDAKPYHAAKQFAGRQVVVTGLKKSRAGIDGFEVHAVKEP